MGDHLPFRVEYAKTGRASCKSCKSPIAKDSLRLAKIVQVSEAKINSNNRFFSFQINLLN